MRVGLGFDIHQVSKDRKLVLGGVTIQNEFGLLGDSDGDVLIHSIIDAILGAANMGDIGSFFGVGLMGVKSLDLLKKLPDEIQNLGLSVSNIDSTVVAQTPALSSFRTQMRESMAKLLHIDQSRVSIKFTTPKGLGPLGASEGIAALSVVLLEEK